MSTAQYTSLGTSEDITGDIFVPRNEDEGTTLDEPVTETLMRDVKAVGNKFVHVLIPRDDSELLKDWDLWGPLLLCTLLAILLQGHSGGAHDGGPQFAQVFVIIWAGAAVVTMNSKLLDGKLSFFQSICVLGYCVLPLTIAAVIVWITTTAFKKSVITFIIDLLVTALGFGWSMFAAVAFLKPTNNPGKKLISTYPVGLFYFVIAWLVFSQG